MSLIGIYLPVWMIALGLVGGLGAAWSMSEKSWGAFTFFLALEFCIGLTVYFKLLGA